MAVMFSLSVAMRDTEYKNGTKVQVKKAGKVIYETPCGYTEILNPLSAKNGGGALSGAAVEAMATITVRYWNRSNGCFYKEPTYMELIKNFPMADYELDFIRTGCAELCYWR